MLMKKDGLKKENNNMKDVSIIKDAKLNHYYI